LINASLGYEINSNSFVQEVNRHNLGGIHGIHETQRLIRPNSDSVIMAAAAISWKNCEMETITTYRKVAGVMLRVPAKIKSEL
jgi:hypothetical protein